MPNKENKRCDIVKSEKISRDVMRQSFYSVFQEIGGIEHLKQFAIDNPKQFYTLIVKLFPEQKESKGDNIPKHETFIQMVINEDKTKQNDINKPTNIIELPIDNTNNT